ncbi:hypothetical protein ACP3WI_25310, partial [Salmonella enterica]|uniref:hypothetical protein n=1 Tax=Salmonella enterica TaxID=28901 RepID=UPI003CF1070C
SPPTAQPAKMHGPTASNGISDAAHGDFPVFCGPTTCERRYWNAGAPTGRAWLNTAFGFTL